MIILRLLPIVGFVYAQFIGIRFNAPVAGTVKNSDTVVRTKPVAASAVAARADWADNGGSGGIIDDFQPNIDIPGDIIGTNEDLWTLVGSGLFTVHTTGNYRFQSASDDSSRIILAGRNVVVLNDCCARVPGQNQIRLLEGQQLAIQTVIGEGGGGGYGEFSVSVNCGPFQVLGATTSTDFTITPNIVDAAACLQTNLGLTQTTFDGTTVTPVNNHAVDIFMASKPTPTSTTTVASTNTGTLNSPVVITMDGLVHILVADDIASDVPGIQVKFVFDTNDCGRLSIGSRVIMENDGVHSVGHFVSTNEDLLSAGTGDNAGGAAIVSFPEEGFYALSTQMLSGAGGDNVGSGVVLSSIGMTDGTMVEIPSARLFQPCRCPPSTATCNNKYSIDLGPNKGSYCFGFGGQLSGGHHSITGKVAISAIFPAPVDTFNEFARAGTYVCEIDVDPTTGDISNFVCQATASARTITFESCRRLEVDDGNARKRSSLSLIPTTTATFVSNSAPFADPLVVAASASACEGLHNVPLITSDLGVAPFSSDWSAISFAEPACVVVPTTTAQLQHVIKYARLNGLLVSARGNGHSTGGHTLNGNNIVVDTQGFDDVRVDVGHGVVEAGVGAFWIDVVTQAALVGKRPAALVDTVSETTVGGVVSLAGTSALALTNGLAVDAVVSFDAVDGKGNVHRGVSADKERALFAAARGGLGQFAILTHVRIRLVDIATFALPDGGVTDATGGAFPPAVLSHTFVFANDALFAAYIGSLAGTATAASIDGADIISLKNDVSLFQAVFGTLGTAIYGAIVSNLSPSAPYYHIVNVIDLVPLNAALAAPPTGALPLGATAFSWLTFALRNVEQFGRARQSLAWYAPKASRVVFVPHDSTKTPDLIAKVLAKLEGSAEFYGDIVPACQLSLKLLDTALVSETTLVRVPRAARHAIEVGVICLDDIASAQTQSGATNLAQRQRRLQSEIDALIRTEANKNWGQQNVKAYQWNSQWECWHDHFGSAWPVVVALKQRYDPCAILGRGVGMFPQQRTRACSSGIDQAFECAFGSESSSDASSSDTVDSDDSKHLHLLQNALNVDVSDLVEH